MTLEYYDNSVCYGTKSRDRTPVGTCVYPDRTEPLEISCQQGDNNGAPGCQQDVTDRNGV